MNIADKLIKDKQDVIILGTDSFTNFITVIGGIISLVICLGIGIIFLWQGILFNSTGTFLFGAILILLGVLIMWRGTLALLVNISVVVDKKSKKVTINKKSVIKYLNSIREVPFSHIAMIEVNRAIYSESRDSWSINLFTIDRESIEIYYAKGELDAKSVAETISGAIETDYLIVPINQCTEEVMIPP